MVGEQAQVDFQDVFSSSLAQFLQFQVVKVGLDQMVLEVALPGVHSE